MERTNLSFKNLYKYQVDYIYNKDAQILFTEKELEFAHSLISSFILFIERNPKLNKRWNNK